MPTYIITTSPNLSSVPNYFFGLADELHRRGNVVVVITDKNKPHLLPPTEDGKYFFSWPSRRPTALKDLLFFRRICLEHKPDCVIGNFGAQNLVLVAGLLLGIKYRVAYWHTMLAQMKADSNGAIKHRLLLWRKKWLLKICATHIFTNSETNRDEIISNFKLPPGRVYKFHLLIPSPLKTVTHSINRENTISFVGRLDKSKRQYLLLNAVPELLKLIPDLKVYIVGKGSEENNLKQLTKELGIEDIVHFTGDIPLHEVYEILNMSKIHISASVEEAFGLVNVEALAAGTPIIAPETGGLKEILADGYNGHYYDPLYQQDLVAKITTIINGDWAVYSENARQSFLDRFCNNNIDKQVDEYEQLFGKE